MVFLDGYDGSDIHFRVSSLSLRGHLWVVWVRLDTGAIICECPGYIMGKRRGNFKEGAPGCRHCKIVANRLMGLMDGPKPTLQDYAATVDDRF